MYKGPWRRLVVPSVVAGLLVLAGSPAAQADFVSPFTTQCSGGEAAGITTGLQIELGERWRAEFLHEDTGSPLACTSGGPNVRYTTATSSEALAALGATNGMRNSAYAFAGNEEPPTLAQWLKIDAGDKPGTDSGLVRQVPVAVTAVVPLVSFPKGCKIPANEVTPDKRFTVSNSLLEQAYAGAIATWGELLPDIAASCASIPIERVVPSVSDGTTFVFKQWLGKVNSSRGWPESSSNPNTTWPNDSGATATVRSSGGDRGEARLVAKTSGSIGFASLPQAREAEFGVFSPENPNNVVSERLFWLSVQNGAGEQVEPTRDPESGVDDVLGANCDDPQFNYTPSGYDTTVTPVWRTVTAAGSSVGWPICTLTYSLVWDDASTVYGDTEEVEAKQRTAKDFLAYVLSPAGQEEAAASDYSALPSQFLADAQEGLSDMGWNK